MPAQPRVDDVHERETKISGAELGIEDERDGGERVIAAHQRPLDQRGVLERVPDGARLGLRHPIAAHDPVQTVVARTDALRDGDEPEWKALGRDRDQPLQRHAILGRHLVLGTGVPVLALRVVERVVGAEIVERGVVFVDARTGKRCHREARDAVHLVRALEVAREVVHVLQRGLLRHVVRGDEQHDDAVGVAEVAPELAHALFVAAERDDQVLGRRVGLEARNLRGEVRDDEAHHEQHDLALPGDDLREAIDESVEHPRARL